MKISPKNIIKLWDEFNVPTMKTRQFNLGIDDLNFSWFDVKQNQQFCFSNNPIQTTAYHLIVSLKNKDPEQHAAFKIAAILKEKNVLCHDMADYLNQIVKLHDMNIHHWLHQSARYVLPSTTSASSIEKDIIKKSDWKKVLEYAAQTWTEIAAEWELIITPEFMDQDSDEYLEIRELLQQNHDQREYNQYLYLKKKFEN